MMRARRQVVIAAVLDHVFTAAAQLGRLHPGARARAHQLDVLRDVPYRDGGGAEHTLDVYRPSVPGPWPVVVYFHGGSFRILSKDTHWMMGVGFARAGYLTVLPNYRLAPAAKFPAALEDAVAAVRWVAREIADHGGDPTRLILAGESAGANLTLALTVAASFRRPELAACAMWESGVRPCAALPACGILQVSAPERFDRERRSFIIRDRIAGVAAAYLPADRTGCALADPLCILESAGPPDRPLPPIFAAAGTADPILDDTRRLGVALERLGVPHDVRYYEGETHAFQMFPGRPAAQRFWQDQLAFLTQQLTRTHIDPPAAVANATPCR